MSKIISKDYPSRKKLEMLIQDLSNPSSYNNDLEQYLTDPHVASMLIYQAYQNGDIEGKTVADLGCGNGVLAYGAAVMGAKLVYAIDADPEMTKICGINCGGLQISIVNSDVTAFNTKVDTVLMNPPFGSVRKHADLPFIEAAASCASTIYAIHNIKTRDFIEEHYNAIGEIFMRAKVLISVPRIYPHHREEFREMEGIMFALRVRDKAKKPN